MYTETNMEKWHHRKYHKDVKLQGDLFDTLSGSKNNEIEGRLWAVAWKMWGSMVWKIKNWLVLEKQDWTHIVIVYEKDWFFYKYISRKNINNNLKQIDYSSMNIGMIYKDWKEIFRVWEYTKIKYIWAWQFEVRKNWLTWIVNYKNKVIVDFGKCQWTKQFHTYKFAKVKLNWHWCFLNSKWTISNTLH